MANHTLLASNDPQGNPTQQASTSTTEIGHRNGLDAQATGSPVVNPVMTSAVVLMTPTAAPPIKNIPQPSRCWKCHHSTLVSTLDDIWEASASWCCWLSCCVDLYDDGEWDGCGHDNRVVSGNGQGSIRPRRVMLDGMPVMVY
jgi:hypothetical protein